MKTASLTNDKIYKEDKPSLQLLMETEVSKEIRILMRKGQVMKKHKAPRPIVVELFEGKIEFGVNDTILHLKKGDLLSLDSNVPHDLVCKADAIIRLSISKTDSIDRVHKVINN